MYTKNGLIIDINIPQVIDEMQYPVGWLHSAKNREALGIADDGLPQPSAEIGPLKVFKNEQINQWRAQANQSTFPHAGKHIACDQLSRSDIDGVANSISLSGGFPTGFPMAWKTTDNDFIMLPDIDSFKAMYASMSAQGAANFKRAQELKAQVEAATSAEDLAVIVW